ncbi:ATP-binding cassette domain-containing protein [Bifidobacterium sp. SMB2]|uniref:ATP-binding cassette domain-containing protein n=1 Tax=Bifidobacterium sp. SMB2 TaxID=2661626 RepID=UPI0013D1A748|nr:ATP-binding cassette domain-containing protein [Bifidobacterium sp. SMB2]NEG96639.1 ATP-binding cassette domain-containing protein [Bifidobacterium sp. SMB2]
MTDTATDRNVTPPAADLADLAVRAESVGFWRDRRLILADVNLNIRRGEKWILFGPNGIGKSTLIAMMSLRQFPNVGRLSLLDHRPGGIDKFASGHRIALASSAVGREVAPPADPLDVIVDAAPIRAVPEDLGDSADVVELSSHRENRRREGAEYERAYALMERFGIEYLAGKRMAGLSEGERTRVLICRNLMSAADLMIFDEPTTGMDLGGRELVVRELGRLGEGDGEFAGAADRTVILVTHQLEEIPAGFDHLALMGHMPEERYREYLADHPNIYAPDLGNPMPGTVTYTGGLEDGFTSEHLTGMFGFPIDVRRHDGRWSAFRA